MEEERKDMYSLLPKGVILSALGGYAGGEFEKAQKIADALYEFMERNKFVIVPIDGKLEFYDFKTEEDEKK